MKIYLLLGIIGILFYSNLGFTQGQTTITVNSDGNYVTCNGFIIDSGGQGGAGYLNNEDYTVTICPSTPGDIVNITFNIFNLDNFDDDPLAGANHINVDEMFVYDGNSTSANALGNYSGNQLQGVLIQCSPQNTSGCLTFRFVSNSQNNAGNWTFSGSALCVTPCNDPVAAGGVVGGFTNDSIHACINEPIQFNDLGSFAQNGFSIVNYSWDFMDGSLVSGQNVTHSYSIPGHYRVQLFVTDDNGCSNNNLIDVDVLVATIPTFVNFQPDTVMCIGETLNVLATPQFYENTWSGFSGSTTIENGCLPDTLLGIAQEIDVIQTGFTGGSSITNPAQIESLCLELEHSFMGDIVVMVTCPNGQNVILHQQGGGGTQIGVPNQLDNIDCSDPSTLGTPLNYCFTPTATTTWVDYANQFGGDLPAGDYEPIQPLSNLVGCPTNGVWTLTVVDNWAADDGHVVSFSINLDTNLYADVVEFTPQLGASSDSSYWTFPATFASNLSPDGESMTIMPTATGTFSYTYSVISSFGCQNDTSFTLDVFDFTMPINIEDTVVCTGNTNLAQFLVTGCTYTIHLIDDYGDGWSANNLSVNQGGVVTNYTIANFTTSADFTINVNHGELITFNFNSDINSWPEECSYQILDSQGNIVFQDGGNFTAPSSAVQTLTVECVSGYDFVWTPANIFDDPTSSDPVGNFMTNQNVSVTVFPTGHPACGVTDNAIVSIATEPIHLIDTTVTICQFLTGPINLFTIIDPSIPLSGVWSNPSGVTVPMPYMENVLPAGVYTYDYFTNNCFGHDEYQIDIIYENPIISDFSVLDPDICIGDTSNFVNLTQATNIFASIVYFGDGDSLIVNALNPFNHLYTHVGSYDLEVVTISNLGCIYSKIYQNIERVHDLPTANFINNPDVLTTMSPQTNLVDMSSSDVISYEWHMPGAIIDTSTLRFPFVEYPILVPGDFIVTQIVTNSTGCKDTISKILRIEDVVAIFIPNSFTPNGDELNNSLKLVSTGVDLQEFLFRVYNRWGQLIFESNDVNVGWDGSYGNRLVQAGIYQWTIDAVDDLTDIPIHRSGFVNVFR